MLYNRSWYITHQLVTVVLSCVPSLPPSSPSHIYVQTDRHTHTYNYTHTHTHSHTHTHKHTQLSASSFWHCCDLKIHWSSLKLAWSMLSTLYYHLHDTHLWYRRCFFPNSKPYNTSKYSNSAVPNYRFQCFIQSSFLLPSPSIIPEYTTARVSYIYIYVYSSVQPKNENTFLLTSCKHWPAPCTCHSWCTPSHKGPAVCVSWCTAKGHWWSLALSACGCLALGPDADPAWTAWAAAKHSDIKHIATQYSVVAHSTKKQS